MQNPWNGIKRHKTMKQTIGLTTEAYNRLQRLKLEVRELNPNSALASAGDVLHQALMAFDANQFVPKKPHWQVAIEERRKRAMEERGKEVV